MSRLVRSAICAVRRAGLPSSEHARTQRNAAIAFAVRVASAAILFLSQILLARWMGGHDYGIYVTVWSWVLLLGGLASIGINSAVMRLVPEYRATGQLDALRGLLLGGRALVLAIGVAVALGAIGCVWTSGDQASPGYQLPLLLALTCVPAYALTDLQDGIGRANGRMASALVPPYILRPLILLAVVGGAHALGLPVEAATAAVGAVLATWLAWAVQSLLVERELGADVPAGPRTFLIGRWIAISLPLLVMNACELLLQNIDVLVISRLLSPTEAGIYFASAKTITLIMFVNYAVGSAMAGRLAASHAVGDGAALRRAARDAVRWTFWPSLGVAILILIAGEPLLALFGPQFTAGYPVMVILAAGFLVRTAVGPVELILNASGGQASSAKSLAAAALVAVVLNPLLVPWLGIAGSALATAAALATAGLMGWCAARRHLGFDPAIWGVGGRGCQHTEGSA